MDARYETGKFDGQFDIACQILDILNNEQLTMLQQILKIKLLCKKLARR